MLDLKFCNNSLLTYFNDFQVATDLGSDQKFTTTTMNPKKRQNFSTAIKNQVQKKLEKTHENFTDHQISSLRSIQKG